ncbi:diguanylate cyclase (GGDEF)-like protein [Paenibacillus taihuensis]|uniref:Diguanylate cyclase (GGDEF)-like protein n=1 Tax=Paenibacillus taihuensis TaxID=1156355 RepID=A0A3D9SGJ8_9BACL|nr:diguanylate cyclase [Paenibacillus taihuensis]REE91375.1 diguanylate cyclase (GGDEF)-like protein [Paenibacillus taihuensis]
MRQTNDREWEEVSGALFENSRRQYIDQLRNQVETLRLLMEQAAEEAELEQLRKFYHIVHMIKGSAPILGLARVGAIAARIAEWWEWTGRDYAAFGEGVLYQRYRQSLEGSRYLLEHLWLEAEGCADTFDWGKQQSTGDLSDYRASNGGRILVVEEDAVLRRYLADRLTLEGYEVHCASDRETALTLLQRYDFQLVTLELMLDLEPEPRSRHGLLTSIKREFGLEWIPIIVLSGNGDVQDKINCLQAGADDYLTKPFQYEELSARIYRSIAKSRAYESMAFQDPLTGLYNRRYFDRQVQIEVNRAQNRLGNITLVLIDIDHFKAINDNYGHSTGDSLLQSFSSLLKASFRQADIVARWGGEEFMVIMPNTTESEAEQVIDSIMSKVRENPVLREATADYSITFSAGVAQWVQDVTIEDWIMLADYALYKAKRNGRNRLSRYSRKRRGGVEQ